MVWSVAVLKVAVWWTALPVQMGLLVHVPFVLWLLMLLRCLSAFLDWELTRKELLQSYTTWAETTAQMGNLWAEELLCASNSLQISQYSDYEAHWKAKQKAKVPNLCLCSVADVLRFTHVSGEYISKMCVCVSCYTLC